MTNPKMELKIHVHPQALLRDDGERVVTVNVDVIAPTTSQGVRPRPLNMALVLDKSGSMGEAAGGRTKLDLAKDAAKRLVGALADHDTFSLIAFSTTTEVVVSATQVGPHRNRILGALDSVRPESATYLAPALKAAMSEIATGGTNSSVNRLFVLTDGHTHDSADCLEVGQTICSSGISALAGGISSTSDPYDHDFLTKLCGSEARRDQYLVEHIETPDNIAEALQHFLNREGHVLTANCRLFVTSPRMVQIRSITAEEHAQGLTLDDQQSVSMKDLYPGKIQPYVFEFVVTPRTTGTLTLAAFRLVYDFPTLDKVQENVHEDAKVEVTEDRSRANVPAARVLEVVSRIAATRQLEKAHQDIAQGNLRGATTKLRGVTKRLDDLGDKEDAVKIQQLADQIEADPNNPELGKKTRQLTKRLTEK